jgi:hypothetical protein
MAGGVNLLILFPPATSQSAATFAVTEQKRNLLVSRRRCDKIATMRIYHHPRIITWTLTIGAQAGRDLARNVPDSVAGGAR